MLWRTAWLWPTAQNYYGSKRLNQAFFFSFFFLPPGVWHSFKSLKHNKIHFACLARDRLSTGGFCPHLSPSFGWGIKLLILWPSLLRTTKESPLGKLIFSQGFLSFFVGVPLNLVLFCYCKECLAALSVRNFENGRHPTRWTWVVGDRSGWRRVRGRVTAEGFVRGVKKGEQWWIEER